MAGVNGGSGESDLNDSELLIIIAIISTHALNASRLSIAIHDAFAHVPRVSYHMTCLHNSRVRVLGLRVLLSKEIIPWTRPSLLSLFTMSEVPVTIPVPSEDPKKKKQQKEEEDGKKPEEDGKSKANGETKDGEDLVSLSV